MPTEEISRINMDKICSHHDTWNGILVIIIIGEEKGNMEPQNAAEENGWDKVTDINTIEIMIGMVIGNVKVCASLSSVTAAPIAANWEA